MPMLTAAFLVCALQAPLDWPCFGGPNRDARVPALKTDFAWGEQGPEVKWRVATAGPGFSGVAVQGDEVFLFDCDLGEGELLRVFDLATGDEKWSAGYEAKGRVQFPGPRCVPAVTSERVFTSGAFGHVACYDRGTHELAWQNHLVETYGGEDPGFGFSTSPLLVDDLVVFSPLGSEVGLVALEQKSGEERWVTEGLGVSHSSPVVLELLGEPTLVVLTTEATPSGLNEAAPMRLNGVDPKTGALRWHHTLTLTRLPVPPPVKVADDKLFLTGGYRGGSTLLQLEKKDGKVAFRELFHIERGSQTHPALLHDGHLYLVVNENWNDQGKEEEGGLLCLGLDGKERWRTGDAPYFGRGASILAGGYLLLQDGRDGVLRVAKADPTGYQEVAAHAVFGEARSRDEQMWAPMALAGEYLLLRSQEELVCLKP